MRKTMFIFVALLLMFGFCTQGYCATSEGTSALAGSTVAYGRTSGGTIVRLLVEADGTLTTSGSGAAAVVGGGTEATAQRVTIANDSTGLLSVDDNAGSLTVDNATISVVGSGAEATAQRVTIANDSTGLLSVDDNGGSLTVDNAALSVVGGGAEATALRVTLANDSTGILTVDNAGTFAVQNAITDDWDATHASASSADGAQIMGAGYSTALPTDVGADADATRIMTDRYGRVLAGIMPQNFQATISSADAQSATQVKAKTADRKMYITSLLASTDTALNLQFQDDTGPTVLIENVHLAANGGFVMNYPPEAPLVVNTNEDFDVIASAAGNISVTITGYLAE